MLRNVLGKKDGHTLPTNLDSWQKEIGVPLVVTSILVLEVRAKMEFGARSKWTLGRYI